MKTLLAATITALFVLLGVPAPAESGSQTRFAFNQSRCHPTVGCSITQFRKCRVNMPLHKHVGTVRCGAWKTPTYAR